MAQIEAEDGEPLVVTPPFGLAHAAGEVPDRPRLAAARGLEEDHLVAVLLVRLGGYAAGVLDGERLVASRWARAS